MPLPMHNLKIEKPVQPPTVEHTEPVIEIQAEHQERREPSAAVENATESAVTPSITAVHTTVSQASSDQELLALESILAEGMDSFFTSLAPQKQLEFKTLGESTAARIKTIVHSGRYKIKDIVQLIINWLKSLPGINAFFLEQEAKIKADKVIDYYARRK